MSRNLHTDWAILSILPLSLWPCVQSRLYRRLFQRSLVSSHPLSLTSCLPWFTHNNISSFSHIPPAPEICSLMLFTETQKRRRFPSSSLFVIILVTKRMKNWKKMRIVPTVPVSDGKSQRGGRFGLVCFLFPASFCQSKRKAGDVTPQLGQCRITAEPGAGLRFLLFIMYECDTSESF